MSPTATPTASVKRPGFDVSRIREDFPALHQTVHGKPLVYLDNAATSQKPTAVIEAIRSYYSAENSNIHRGVHYLSQEATLAYEGVRSKIQKFIGAAAPEEIIFVRGTTEAVNLVASSYGRRHVRRGDEIVISTLEHHSNIVPWQILAEETGSSLKVIPVTDTGELILEDYGRLLNDRTRLVAVTHVSNALGTVNPVKEIVRAAHERGIPVLVDGAQAVPHMRIDVRELDCDFYAFSGHKMFGPTGIGVLYGKKKLLEAMPPYQGGGDMIKSVTFEKTIYNDLPYKFEAGTPHIAGVIGLGAAVDYLALLDPRAVASYEHELLRFATEELSNVEGLTIIGTAPEKASVISFTLDGVHPHDIGTILDADGIAIRTGHHCAQPLMKRFGIPATARASFAFYNAKEEALALGASIRKVRRMLAL